MVNNFNKYVNKNDESKLSAHKQFKKELKPPLLQINNLELFSWINERLPEMLWAVLIIGNIDRESALELFRHIADDVSKNQDCYDIILSGISKFTKNKKKEFIKRITSWSDEVTITLRPLILFPDLPAINDWKAFLDQPIVKDDWQTVYNGILKSFQPSSEGATDCRWFKLLCQIAGGKMRFNNEIENIKDILKGVVEYPNYGDLSTIRPFIRSTEMALNPTTDKNYSEWSLNFWQYCFDHTACTPEEKLYKRISKRQKKLFEEREDIKNHYFNETMEVRNKLIEYYLNCSKTSAVDSRLECAFGIALYSITLFIEIIFYGVQFSIIGRVYLRLLVEAYITFKYLLKKEKDESRIWDDYRCYGTGQLKFAYLKLKELGQEISCIEIGVLDQLINEDKWIELVPINLGHWDSVNLKIMSEEVGLKEFYDKYYSYTSGYIHANWGAIRESVYQICINPLHRFHRIPILDIPLMPSVNADALEITNCILECLSEAYPKFDIRLTKADNNKDMKADLTPRPAEPSNPPKAD